ncbi:hypothetical protein RFI_19267, partial [Reticulomyxa filosa]
SIRHVVYGHVAEICKTLDFAKLKYLFGEIEQTPHGQFDSQLLELIKTYTLTAFAVQRDDPNNKSWFGLQVLWNFIQSCDCVADANGVCFICVRQCVIVNLLYFGCSFALNFFFFFLKINDSLKCQSRSFDPRKSCQRRTGIVFGVVANRTRAITKNDLHGQVCIDFIQKGTKVVQNIIMLQKIIQTYPRTKKTWLDSSFTQSYIIEKLDKDRALLDRFFEDLTLYKGRVLSFLDAHRQDKVWLFFFLK